jgi:hypothetical protein
MAHQVTFPILAAGLALLVPTIASAQSPVTCSSQTQSIQTIRNEGKTEQIGDYFFSCINGGSTTATATVTASVSAPVSSKVLNPTTGATEATLVIVDSGGRQATQKYLGTVSGNIVTFSNVPIPTSTDNSAPSPFILDVTNVRVDATSLPAGANVTETVFISGSLIQTANFPAAATALVESGLGPQNTSGVVNFPVCGSVTGANPAFNVKFGENPLNPLAFKKQGGSGNTAEESWLTNNTETGYYVQASVNGALIDNTASSGTRIRIVFSNIPANVNIYVPLSPQTDQPGGTLSLTTTESGPYTPMGGSAPPAGYTGSANLAQLTVTNGVAEAVYEVATSSSASIETYTVPVYLGSSGTVTSQAAAITAAVSFAPVNASANIPNFSQLFSTTVLSGSQFPNCLTITNTLLSEGVLGIPYNQTVMPTGGILPYMFSITGNLPPGLSFNASTGAIVGTPSGTMAGTYNFTVGVSDSGGQSLSQPYSIQVVPAVYISGSSLPTGAAGENYSGSVMALDGFGSYTWSVVSGSLPPGTTLNTVTGVISGRATAAGSSTFTLKVLDSSTSSAQQQFTVTINTTLTITTTAVTPSVVGFANPTVLAASGGTGGYTWSLISGAQALSAVGLTFTSGGTFSGTATAAATNIPITVQLADPQISVTRNLTVTVNPPLSIPTPSLPNAIVGVPYSFSDPITTGYQPGNCLVYSGSTPPGINPSGALTLSGTPIASGGYTFVIRCNDAYSETALSNTFTLTSNPALSIITTSLPNGFTTTPYNSTVSTNGGGTGSGYTFAVQTGSLPAGLSLNSSTGAITGTPTAIGSNSFTIQVTDSGNNTAMQAYSVPIYGLLTVTTTSLNAGVVGFAYNKPLASTGGSGGNVWSIPSGALPAGLSLNASTGTISGTPTAAGTSQFSIKVTDSNNDAATVNFSLTIANPISITTTSLPSGSVGTAYNQTVAVSGGVAPLMFSLAVPGSLQGPLQLNSSTGAITGTPTGFGTSNFTVVVSDSSGYQDSANKTYILVVGTTLSITSTALPVGTVSQAYRYTLTASGGSGNAANYSWSATGLPAGLTLSAAGVLSGTSAVSGTTSGILVTVTDSSTGQMATQTYSLTLYPTPTLDFVSAVTASNPLAYFRLNSASGTDQTGVYTYVDSSQGAAVRGPGAPITGTAVSYTALDGVAGNVTTTLSGNVNTAGSMMAWVNLSALPSSQSNFSYVAGESQVGNDFDLQFSLTNSLNFYTTNNGQYLGYTPNPLTLLNQWHMIVVTYDNTAGKRAIYWDGNIVASDTTQSLTNKTGAFQIGNSSVFGGRYFPGGIEEVAVWNYALTQAQVAQLRDLGTFLPPASQNVPYGPVSIGASGGSGSFTYTASPLPAGLTMSPGGSIAGTPTATGTTAPITVTATDTVTSNVVSQNSFSLTVYPPLTISSTLPTPVAGVAYSQTATATGGYGGQYYWTIPSGTLPGGLTLNSSTGVLSGTASTGSSSFTLQVTDGVGLTATQMVTFNIGSNPPSITTTTLPGADQGSAYSKLVAASGGTGSYAYSISSGSLPTSLSINSATGLISGTPSASGSFSFTVQVKDSANNIGTQSYTVVVNPTLTFSTATLPNGAVGNSYNQRIAGTGGLTPYTFAIAPTSSLPPGLTLNATSGAVSGTPTATGSYSVVVNLTDALQYSTSTTYQIIIGQPPTISTTSLPPGQQGAAYSAQVAAAGGSGSGYSFAVTSGSLPAGVTLSTAGALSGTPTANGVFSPTITVTDSNNATGSLILPLNINVAGTVITTNLPANTAIINISGTQYGAAFSSGNNQIYWAGPFSQGGGALLEYSIQPGTYTFRIVDPADAGSIYPALTAGQLSNIFTGWTYNLPWITAYLVFDSSAVGSNSITQLFSGADQTPGAANAQAAYNQAVSSGAYNQLRPGYRSATPVYTYTFSRPQTLVFAVPDNGLSDNGGGVSVLISPTFATNPAILTSQSLPSATTGVLYSVTLSASGGSGNYVWSSTTLPGFLTLTPGGMLSGTPGAGDVGMQSFGITVTDPVSGNTATQNFSLTVGSAVTPLSVNALTLPIAVQGTSYSQTFSASGGTGAATFALSGGSLPAGLTLSGNGMLSGTPTANGSFTFTVKATDQASATATRQFTLQVNAPLTISTTTLPAATMGAAYSQTLVANGGLGTYTWSVTQGTFTNAGFALNASTGAITGTPVTSNTLQFTVQVTDTNMDTATQTLNIAIGLQTTSTLDFAVAMGAPTATHSILRVSANGTRTSVICSGAPCHANDITADSQGNIYAHDATGIAKITPGGTVTQVLNISGNSLFSGGSGVGGIALDGLGNIIFVDNIEDAVYRVTTAGTNLTKVANFPILSPNEAQDAYVAVDHSGNYIVASDDNQAAKIYSFTPAGVPTTLITLPGKGSSGVTVDGSNHPIFVDYLFNAIASVDSSGGHTVFAEDPALCCTLVGLTFDSTTGSFVSDLTLSNSLVRITPAGAITTILTGAPLNYPMSVTQIPVLTAPTVTQTSLPAGVAGQAYGPVTLTATGGSGSYSWSAAGLPSGVFLSTSGTLSGSPAAAATYPVNITVTDTVTMQVGHATLNLIVSPPVVVAPPLTISSSASFIGVALGGSVSASFTASGGAAPYNFTATGLPSGVSLSSTGALSGTPAQAGSFSGTVQVLDSHGNSASTSITIGVLGLTTTALPNGVAGQFYSASLSAVGGTGPYSFSGTGIPAGLSLSSAGALTGTVTTAGGFTIGVRVSDSGGLSVSGNVSVNFTAPRGLTISGAALPVGTVNTPYSQTLAASGGFSPYTWAVSSGATPGGLSLSPSGTLSGIPTTPGSFSFGVMARDNSGAVTTATASVTIQALPLTVTTQSLPSGVVGVGYPQQVLAATGGMQPYSWAVTSGGLPTGLALTQGGSLSGLPTVSGSFPVTITVTDQAGAQGMASFTVVIRPSSTDLILSVSSLNFAVMAPSAATPPGQQIGVQSTQPGQVVAYTAGTSPSVAWLTLTNGAATPDAIQASLNSAALMLSAGTYSTTISVTCSSAACAGRSQTVSVSLTVTAAPPQLGVTTDLLAFGGPAGTSQPLVQSVSIQNAGGGSLGLASVTCEAAWCSAGGAPGSLAGGVGASIPISIDPTLLTAGFFRTQVDIVSSAGRASVPVTVLLTSLSSMVLAPAGEQFSMQAGGAPGNPAGSFLVSVANGSAVSWTASVLPGAPWLILNSPSGSSSATAPGSVSFSIDPKAAAALAPGAYYGRIEVAGSGLVNSPQDFEVVLSVSPATTPVIPDAEPAGLLFITTVGGTPPPQTVTLYSGSSTASGFQAGAVTFDGKGWLSVTPATGNSSNTSPGVTIVTVNPSGLTPGVYRGGVNYSLSATAVREVSVTVIVTPPGTTGQLISGNSPDAAHPKAGSCTPSVLVPVQTGLVDNFAAAVAWPTPLSVALENDCGAPVTSGQMVATFSNGDPPLPLSLTDPVKGIYSGTWTPRSASPQMTVTAHASASGYPSATAQLEGATVPNAAPVLTPHGTLHSFDPLVGAALAPGTIIQIYGQNLATGTAQPTTIPLPTTMNGTTVLIGGTPAPLYFVSPGQINAQLPFELAPGNQYQILITVNGALTTPDILQLSPATPGLAAFGDGTLIAQHGDGSLVSTTSPARPGEYLVAYLAGMGGTNATPGSGTASPSSPLALPTATPTLTINGTASPIAFAGLTPGLVGLYQMNFQVPAGLPAGDLTLVVTQNGQASNQTVLPYQP